MKEARKLGDEDQGWNFEESMRNEEKEFQKGEENEKEYWIWIEQWKLWIFCVFFFNIFSLWEIACEKVLKSFVKRRVRELFLLQRDWCGERMKLTSYFFNFDF